MRAFFLGGFALVLGALSLPSQAADPLQLSVSGQSAIHEKTARLRANPNLDLTLESALPAVVKDELDKAGIPLEAVGIAVYDVQKNKPRIEVNATHLFNPASTMKIVTTAAALDMLEPDYRWRTQIYTDTLPLNGAVGNVFIKGGGDPKLTLEDFWLMLRKMRAQGIRDILGDVVLDRSYFELPNADPGQFDGQPLRAYNVLPDPLLLNFNTLLLTLMPDETNNTVSLYAEPHPSNLDIVSTIKLDTKTRSCNNWHNRLKPTLSKVGKRFTLSIDGLFASHCGVKGWYLAPLDASDFVYGVFRQLWQEMGGTIQGTFRDGKTPQNAKWLAEKDSSNVVQILSDINKYSNNVMARMLFLSLAAKANPHVPASESSARQVALQWLAQKGISNQGVVLDNGSGLSRDTRISPEQLAQVLKQAWHHPLMPEFIASLPISAVDGTVQRRKNLPPLNMHLKTGTIDEVKAIAGFVLDRKQQMQVVVFIVNHPNAEKSRAAQDALLNWVYDAQNAG